MKRDARKYSRRVVLWGQSVRPGAPRIRTRSRVPETRPPLRIVRCHSVVAKRARRIVSAWYENILGDLVGPCFPLPTLSHRRSNRRIKVAVGGRLRLKRLHEDFPEELRRALKGQPVL